MKKVAAFIPGYSYGSPEVPRSPVSMRVWENLKESAAFTEEDQHYLQLAGQVLSGQTEKIVHHWRSTIIGKLPNLARHSRAPDGSALPEYSSASGLRFEQWILDTCLRPYDQDWLNYQQEIALRHTTLKKNQTDGVQSTRYVPLRDIIAFTTIMNETIKPYLAAKGNSPMEVERMHRAWCKSIQLQIALWTDVYAREAPNEW